MQSNFKVLCFIVKPSQCLLCSDKGEQMLEPKAMSLLTALANANNQLVSRSELFELIWGDQIVTDYALNTLVASLRKSLGDQAGVPQFIETRPKLGYRLVPPIEWIENSKNDQASAFEASSNTINDSTTNAEPRLKNLILWSLLMIILLLALIVFGFNTNLFKRDKGAEHSAREKPDTASSNSKTTHQFEEVLQYKYISRVHITVDYSESNEAGVPICINTDADFVAKLVFSNNRWSLKDYKWTLYSDFYDVDFRHSSKTLAGLTEKHTVEHGHPYGKVIENMSITFDESEDFTGTSAWEVLSFEGKRLCHGKAIFIANKL